MDIVTTSHIAERDHVSYSVPRPIHRPMHRSIYRSLLDRLSTDTRLTCRSTVDRESTDVSVELPLMSAEVSTVTISGAYRSTTGRISVNYRRNVGRVSFDSRARVYRYNLPIYRPILSVIFNNYSPKWRWLVVNIYPAAKRRGKYPTLATSTSVNSCFSIY